MKLRSNLSLSALLLGSILLASCGNNTPTTPTPTTSSITLNCPAATLVSGSAFTCTATAKDASGNVLSTQPTISYTSSNTGVATVDASGKVTAVAPGTAIITAKVGDVTQTFTVTVTAPTTPTTSSIALTCPAGGLTTGGTFTCTATAKDASGNALNPQPTISYSTSNSSVATVDASGKVTAVAPGTAVITASVGGVTQTFTVTVTASTPTSTVKDVSLTCTPTTITTVGYSVCTATAKDASGTALTNQPITYKSSDPSVASVDFSGIVQGLKPGTTTITATAGGVSATQTITVNANQANPLPTVPQQLGSIRLVCDPTVIQDMTYVGAVRPDTSSCLATALDTNGQPMTAQPTITLTSTDTSVATVAAGTQTPVGQYYTVTGQKGGQTTLQATAGGKTSAPVVITVIQTLSSVGVTCTPASILATGTSTCTATGYDKNGTMLTTQPASFSWASSDPTVASIDGSGTVTGIKAGTTGITAQATVDNANAVSNPFTVTVDNNVQVNVTDQADAALSGATVTLTSTAPGATPIAVSADPANPGRYVTSAPAGSYTLNVSATGYQTYSAPVTVSAGVLSVSNVQMVQALDTVSTTCMTPIIVTETTNCTAVARDANGVALATQPTFTWSSNNNGVAGVDPNTGVVTGNSVGSASITASATVAGTTKTGSAPVAVNQNVTIAVKNSAGTAIAADTIQMCPTGGGACITPAATATTGTYLASAPAGNYTLTTTKAGHGTSTQTVTVVAGTPLSATATLINVALTAQVNGNFPYGNTSGATVTLQKCTNSAYTSCTNDQVGITNGSGAYNFPTPLTGGYYKLNATKSYGFLGTQNASQNFQVTDSTTSPLTVTLNW